jgi:hypothetical protein
VLGRTIERPTGTETTARAILFQTPSTARPRGDTRGPGNLLTWIATRTALSFSRSLAARVDTRHEGGDRDLTRVGRIRVKLGN